MTTWFPYDDGRDGRWDDGQVDLSSHDSFIYGVPHNTFRRLRDEAPCHWTDWAGGEGFWSITRHEDITALNRQASIFSSARGIRMEDQSYEEYLARRTFQELDPPDHTAFRMKVTRAFSKQMIAKYEAQITRICRTLLDKVLPMGEFDATAEIARELPMQMLGQIAGLPEEDLPWLVEKGDQLISNTDPDYTDHVLDKMTTDAYRMMPFNSPAGAELWDYAKDFMEKSTTRGETEGLLHIVAAPDKNGHVMPDHEFRNFFCLLVAAGNDTTRYSIAAGLHALANQEGLLEELRTGGEDIWETAADEIIRWASPTMYFRRTAMQDYELHGKSIKEGDKVLYWFVSANRDERVFEQPFRLNLRRKPNRHMAFGQGGPHVCLGMWLARLEIKILFAEVAKTLKSIEQTGDIEFLRSNFISGIKKLPVRITT